MALAFLLAAALVSGAPISPSARPVTRSFAVDLRSKVISFDVPLMSADGAQAYLFWCEGGTDFAGLNALAERHPARHSGVLMCVLNEGDHRDEGSLLADADEAPWFSRGMFRSEHLDAHDAQPALGRVRTFRIRGMLLTLTASHIKTDAKGVRAFTLDVTVQADVSDGTTVAGNLR
jgi:hypothetical protein